LGHPFNDFNTRIHILSQYTDAASRLGQREGSGDDRALFLTEFGGMVITAYLKLVEQYNTMLRNMKQAN
jgi:hypothetical protein